MDNNVLLGIVMAFIGVNDIVIARFLGDRLKLSGPVRSVLTAAGVVFIGLGALLALRMIKWL